MTGASPPRSFFIPQFAGVRGRGILRSSRRRESVPAPRRSPRSLEGVMHFDPEAIACGHGNSKTIPKRRSRRRMGVCCPILGARARGRSTAQPRFARGVQWTEVDRAHRLRLALYATRLAAVGSRLPADEEVARGWRIRGDGPRFACTFAAFGGQSARSYGKHTGLPHPAMHA
jgi:hypothetical protein